MTGNFTVLKHQKNDWKIKKKIIHISLKFDTGSNFINICNIFREKKICSDLENSFEIGLILYNQIKHFITYNL